MRHGVKVRSITLFFLGGVANTESECKTARGEFLMAAAGPAVSLLIGAGLLLGQHAATHLSPALGEMAQRLGELNLVLALFNLLPGLPQLRVCGVLLRLLAPLMTRTFEPRSVLFHLGRRASAPSSLFAFGGRAIAPSFLSCRI
jgi:hypothetical protein